MFVRAAVSGCLPVYSPLWESDPDYLPSCPSVRPPVLINAHTHLAVLLQTPGCLCAPNLAAGGCGMHGPPPAPSLALAQGAGLVAPIRNMADCRPIVARGPSLLA